MFLWIFIDGQNIYKGIRENHSTFADYTIDQFDELVDVVNHFGSNFEDTVEK